MFCKAKSDRTDDSNSKDCQISCKRRHDGLIIYDYISGNPFYVLVSVKGNPVL